MAGNPFFGAAPGAALGPYVSATPIVPNDVNIQPSGTSYRALYVGSPGDVKVLLRNDTVPVIMTLAVGITAIWVKQIFATGTTAGGLLGLN
jgi:hypothetical protein